MLAWFALVPAMSTLRFRLAVSIALAGVAALLILAVGFAVDPAAALGQPGPDDRGAGDGRQHRRRLHAR